MDVGGFGSQESRNYRSIMSGSWKQLAVIIANARWPGRETSFEHGKSNGRHDTECEPQGCQ